MAVRPARYDVVTLIETTTVEAAGDVAASPEYRKLHDAVTAAAREEYLMTARCLRRVGDVEELAGAFLFNFFVAEDPGVALDLWDHLAAWYAVETGLDNSTLLGPVGPSDYVFVNHARWDISLPRLRSPSSASGPSTATCWPTCTPTAPPRCPSSTAWPKEPEP